MGPLGESKELSFGVQSNESTLPMGPLREVLKKPLLWEKEALVVGVLKIDTNQPLRRLLCKATAGPQTRGCSFR